MIKIKQEQYLQILQHARDLSPEEACGLLGGSVQGDSKVVEKVFLLTNVDHSQEHFSMDPIEQFAVIKDLRRQGQVILGNFHSHPETPARPSEEDKRLAFDPNMSYLILSLQDCQNPALKSFRIEGQTATEEQLVIAD